MIGLLLRVVPISLVLWAVIISALVQWVHWACSIYDWVQ